MIDRTIGYFLITTELGKGGMGVVCRAHDTHLDRDVALKFLPPHLTADKTANARFIHETKAASSLQHPAICTTARPKTARPIWSCPVTREKPWLND